MSEILKVLIRFVYDAIPDREVFNVLTYDGKPLPVLGDDYRILGLSAKNQYNIIEMDYDVSEIKYTDETGERSFKLVVTDKDVGKTKGAYSASSNAVLIYIKSFTTLVHDEFFYMDATYFDNDVEERKYLTKTLMDSPNEIERLIKRTMQTIPSTLEHELAHMIQYEFLKPKHEKQVSGGKDDPDSYYNSEIEFSPQIISSIKDYTDYIEYVDKENNKSYRADIFKYLVGLTEKSVYYYEDYTGKEQIPGEPSKFRELISANRHFYNSLKNNDIAQYKRAVKYTYSALHDKGLL